MMCHVFRRKRRINGQLVESPEWFGALRMDWDVRPRRWSLGTYDKREAERLVHEDGRVGQSETATRLAGHQQE